jgi:hypothetical protein
LQADDSSNDPNAEAKEGLEAQTKSAKHYREPNGKNTPPSKIAAVLALSSLGMSQNAIAKVEKMSPQTVAVLVKQGDQHNPALVERIKKSLAAHWYVTAERGLQHITDDKLENSSAAQLAVISSIATEKALLADGKATARMEFVGMADQALQEEIMALESQVAAMKKNAITVDAGTQLGTQDVASSSEVDSCTEERMVENVAEAPGEPPSPPPPSGSIHAV